MLYHVIVHKFTNRWSVVPNGTIIPAQAFKHGWRLRETHQGSVLPRFREDSDFIDTEIVLQMLKEL